MRFRSLTLAAVATVALVAGSRSVAAQEGQGHVFVAARGSGHLGVALDEVNTKVAERLKLKEERGALVREVRPDSPAAKAGLKIDDVIVGYQGAPVEGALDLTRRVRETPPGRTVAIEVVRQGAVQRLSATLDAHQPEPWRLRVPEIDLPGIEMPHVEIPPDIEMPSLPEMPDGPWHTGSMLHRGAQKLGIEYQEVAGQLAEYFKVQGKRGVLVVSVAPEMPAAKAGVKAGDVLVRLGAQELSSGEDLRQAVAKATPGEELSVTVQRDGRPLELKLVVGGPKAEPGQPPAKTKKKERI
jgi:serine protease Do